MKQRRISALLTICFVLILANISTAQDSGKWYAVAYKIHKGSFGDYTTYGAAWNFPSRAEAISAAVAECEKRSRSKCKEYDVGHDICFSIVKGGYRDEAPNFYVRIGDYPYSTRIESQNRLFQTQEEARRAAMEEVRRRNRLYGQ